MQVEYTHHWDNNPSPRRDWKRQVEQNENAIARRIFNHGRQNGSADDTKYVLNYTWGDVYFIVVAFYHTDGRIRLHTVFVANQRGTAWGGGVALSPNQWP